MNRKITTLVLIVMFASPIFAQQSNMDYTPLQPFVPSGILYENNPSHIFHNPSHLNHPMHFLGDDDSLCTASIFKDLYRFFYYANFDTATQPSPVMPSVLNQTISNTSITPEVKLGLMHLNFEAISSEALTNNLLIFDTINSIECNVNNMNAKTIISAITCFRKEKTPQKITITDTNSFYNNEKIKSVQHLRTYRIFVFSFD